MSINVHQGLSGIRPSFQLFGFIVASSVLFISSEGSALPKVTVERACKKGWMVVFPLFELNDT